MEVPPGTDGEEVDDDLENERGADGDEVECEGLRDCH